MEEMKKLILFLTVVILSATISIFIKRNIEKNHVPKIRASCESLKILIVS
jgi:hypothetical protein